MLTEEYFASRTIKDPQAHQKLRELLNNLDEDDNPVIVIGKLK
jgi:PHD/YefM family antitoxin component YafN of YafNO toxin-antitoxin module